MNIKSPPFFIDLRLKPLYSNLYQVGVLLKKPPYFEVRRF